MAKQRKSMRHTVLGARSMVRSVTKRIQNQSAEDPLNWELPELVEVMGLVEDAEAALVAAVLSLRDEHDYSWAQIGNELGITRQAAQQRFGRKTAAA